MWDVYKTQNPICMCVCVCACTSIDITLPNHYSPPPHSTSCAGWENRFGTKQGCVDGGSIFHASHSLQHKSVSALEKQRAKQNIRIMENWTRERETLDANRPCWRPGQKDNSGPFWRTVYSMNRWEHSMIQHRHSWSADKKHQMDDFHSFPRFLRLNHEMYLNIKKASD